MRPATRDFLEAVSLPLDTAVSQALSMIKGGRDVLSPTVPIREIATLRQALGSPTEEAAFETVLRFAVATALHGVGVVLDGGAHLSHQHELRVTLDGEDLEPGIHEMIISYLAETGRAPTG